MAVYKNKGLFFGGVLDDEGICKLYCIVLYCIVLYCIVLYCIVLYVTLFIPSLLFFLIFIHVIFFVLRFVQSNLLSLPFFLTLTLLPSLPFALLSDPTSLPPFPPHSHPLLHLPSLSPLLSLTPPISLS